ncbi:MAG: hypothetical protein IKZ98_12875 [Clostridia bacterium]|nr:hypothetical protein [Clostridia bacterium]
MDAAVSAAREKLKNVTPLKRDCGRVCDARCCRPLEGEETGMLLFPGEAEAYADREDWKIRHTARGDMIVCPGRCNREERPLSCRLFPLLPLIRDDGTIRVVTDLRARAVCPLARQGKSALDPAFIDAVREAGELLAGSDEQALFLDMLEEEQQELKELRKKFTIHNS